MIYRISAFLCLVAASISFWLYSRFTVDDAFITWRYGRNLIDHGIWGYNPTSFDLTQAYTNPIFAALSVIPAALGVNVVMFFKLVSLSLIMAFSSWFIKESKKSWLMLFLLLGLPATVIHASGGLETFLFVGLLSMLFVAMDKNKLPQSIVITLLLFATRPESWVLVALVPTYFLFKIRCEFKFSQPALLARTLFKNVNFDAKRFLIALIFLAVPLSIYFVFHKWHFGYALPNTFYAKSGAFFNLVNFAKFCFFITPLALLLLVGRIKIFAVMLFLFFGMALKYSLSNLQMDYNARFAYQIFFPVYVFVVILGTNSTDKVEFLYGTFKPVKTCSELVFKSVAFVYLCLFATGSGTVDAQAVSYYPRALASHAELGKTLSSISDKYKLRAFSFGDAGMAAYHSDLIALDNIGLGSSLVVHRGISDKVLDEYGLDIIVFYAIPSEIRLKAHGQDRIYDWSKNNGFSYLCDIYWRPDYTLKIYSRVNIPEIVNVCNSSKLANNKEDRDYVLGSVLMPPWKYWN